MKTVSVEMKSRVNERVEQCLDIVRRQYPNTKFVIPHITYDINSARLGGQACGATHMRLNPVFLNTYQDHYITQTVGHELAHLFVNQLYTRRVQSHGAEWKSMMRLLGIPANRCHRYEVPAGVQVGKQVKKYKYQCSVCLEQIEVGAKVHNNLSRGRTYHHKRCGRAGALQPVVMATAAPVKISTPTIPSNVTRVNVPFNHLISDKSKLDKCRLLAKNNPNITKDDLLRAFKQYGDCTSAGALTYFYKLKGEGTINC